MGTKGPQQLIQHMQGQGKAFFSVEDARKILKRDRQSTLLIIGKLRRKHLVATLTDGFYTILEPMEQTHGLMPLRILDPLMTHLSADYYLGLLSAANHWGAAHHKPQVLQVMMAQHRSLRRLKQLRIKTYLKKHWIPNGIVQAKAPFGYYAISSPELTALDVIHYESACGGFENVCLVIHDLLPNLKIRRLLNCCRAYQRLSVIQRLGFLLEKAEASEALLKPLKKWLHTQQPSPIPLSTGHGRKGPIHQDWQIIENRPIGFEE